MADDLYALMAHGMAKPKPAPSTLNVLTEEADKCCRKSVGAFLERWPAAKLASCSECGTDFVPEMVGSVRHWRVQPLVLIHRRED